jgi:hypothetical protein
MSSIVIFSYSMMSSVAAADVGHTAIVSADRHLTAAVVPVVSIPTTVPIPPVVTIPITTDTRRTDAELAARKHNWPQYRVGLFRFPHDQISSRPWYFAAHPPIAAKRPFSSELFQALEQPLPMLQALRIKLDPRVQLVVNMR